MNKDYQSDVPILINITLFKNNYYDQKLLSLIKQKSLYYRKESDNKFTVSSWDMKTLIDENLIGHLNDIHSSTPMEFAKKVDSIYFVDELIGRYSNLKYFTINVSNDKIGSRILYPNGDKTKSMINFDFKIIHSLLDFPVHLDSKGLKKLNAFLRIIKVLPTELYRKGPPYIHINIVELLNKIDNFIDLVGPESTEIEQYRDILDIINELINPKIEIDNPTCLLITDYPK